MMNSSGVIAKTAGMESTAKIEVHDVDHNQDEQRAA